MSERCQTMNIKYDFDQMTGSYLVKMKNMIIKLDKGTEGGSPIENAEQLYDD